MISQVFLLIIGALGIKAYRIILRFPRNIVLGAVLVFSIIGSYALANNLFDVGIVLVFGLVGFFMEKADMPLPPVILGLILGPMIEENLRIGLIKTDGAFGEFFTRPISFVLFLILMLLFFYDPAKRLVVRLFSKKREGAE